MDWRLIVIILCIYGFLKEFRPLEPFLTPYLRSDKNFTDVDLYSKIYPLWTYSYLAALVPIFLLTDLLRYNPVLILGALSYAATWILLIFGRSIGHMQLMQWFYGLATASEVAYYGYGYAAIDAVNYKKTTSYMRFVVECGRFTSYALSQTLVSTDSISYLQLNYIALTGSMVIFLISLCLPYISWTKSMQRIEQEKLDETRPLTDQIPRKSIEIDQKPDQIDQKLDQIDQKLDQIDQTPDQIDQTPDQIDQTQSQKTTQVKVQYPQVKTYKQYARFYFINLWSNFKGIYSTQFMWKWSLWSALATCGMLQVTNYIQTLWDLLQYSRSDIWNGVVEAICMILAAIIVILLQYIRIRWAIWGESILAIISTIDCVVLILMSQLTSLVLNYVLYVVFRVLYEMMFTIAMYNIAKRLSTQSFGLVFGFNTFVALVLQTVLTLAVADERGFALEIRNQFVVYGAYHGAIAVIFFGMGILTLVKYFRLPTQQRETVAL